MGKASRSKRDRRMLAGASSSERSRRFSLPWAVATVVVIALGALLVVVSRDTAEASGPGLTDHWHAALGVNVCGTWAPDPPVFESSAAEPAVTAGIHTHGDGLVHIHPATSSDAGDRATLGRYFAHGGWEISGDSFSIWDGPARENGDTCDDGREGRVVWSVDGEMREGNPADLALANLQVIAIGFLPEGEELGTPPSAASIADADPTEPTIPADPAAPGDLTPVDPTGPEGGVETTLPPEGSAPDGAVPPDATIEEPPGEGAGAEPGDEGAGP